MQCISATDIPFATSSIVITWSNGITVISLHNVSFVSQEGTPQSYPVGYVMSKWHWIETQHRQRHNAHRASHPIAIDLAGDHWSLWWEGVNTPNRSKELKGVSLNSTATSTLPGQIAISVILLFFFKVTSLDIDIDCKHLGNGDFCKNRQPAHAGDVVHGHFVWLTSWWDKYLKNYVNKISLHSPCVLTMFT